MTMPDSVSGAAGAGGAGKPRDVNYDLLRVVAMCLVIGVHVINNYTTSVVNPVAIIWILVPFFTRPSFTLQNTITPL